MRVAQGIPPAPSDALTTAEILRNRHGQSQTSVTSEHSTSSEDAQEECPERTWYSPVTEEAYDDHASPVSPAAHLDPSIDYFPPHPTCGTRYPTDEPSGHYQTMGKSVAYLQQADPVNRSRPYASHGSFHLPGQSAPAHRAVDITKVEEEDCPRWLDQIVASAARPHIDPSMDRRIRETREGQQHDYATSSYPPPSTPFGSLHMPQYRRHSEDSEPLARNAPSIRPGGGGETCSDRSFPPPSYPYRPATTRRDVPLERSSAPPPPHHPSELLGQWNYTQQAPTFDTHSSRQDLPTTGTQRMTARHEASSSEQQGSSRHHRNPWDSQGTRKD